MKDYLLSAWRNIPGYPKNAHWRFWSDSANAYTDLNLRLTYIPASILYKSIAGGYLPVSYPDGTIPARYRFIKMLAGMYEGKCSAVAVQMVSRIACWYLVPYNMFLFW